MANFTKFTIQMDESHQVIALKDVPSDAELSDVLDALELPEFGGVITLVVAAGRMPAEILDASRELFTKSLAPAAEKYRLLVVDGATRYGGMMAIGDAREAIGGTFPLVGLIPIGVLRIPEDLDPYHSHAILVDGNNFGDESKLLPQFLKAGKKARVVIVLNCRVESPYMVGEFPLHAELADVIIPIAGSEGVADALLDKEGALYKSLSESVQRKIKGAALDKPEELTALLDSLFA
jgi:hypothetical protein